MTERRERHRRLAAYLSGLDDAAVAALAVAATRHGFGGATGSARVAGEPVFVKLVPLTDVERAHPRSTANLFDLPMHYHYGIGSSGFGVWREIATHELTTEAASRGTFAGFPLLYHWRIIPVKTPPGHDVGTWVAHWHGHPAIRERLTAMREATASVVIFLEHLPETVHTFLTRRPDALPMIERELLAGCAALRDIGLLHLDAHFENLLTDGGRIYFADFGLALSTTFTMTAEEARFFEDHRSYDRAYTVAHLVRWVAENRLGIPWRTLRADHLRDIGPPLKAHIPVAMINLAFWRELADVSRRTPYPAGQIEAALAAYDPAHGVAAQGGDHPVET